jgi:hypothetical protein
MPTVLQIRKFFPVSYTIVEILYAFFSFICDSDFESDPAKAPWIRICNTVSGAALFYVHPNPVFM